MNASSMLNNYACGFLRFACANVILKIVLFPFITESCIDKGVWLLVECLLWYIINIANEIMEVCIRHSSYGAVCFICLPCC